MGHTILIAHNQAALRRTIRTVLGFLPCVEAVIEEPDRGDVVAQVAVLRPDAVVIGLDGPPSLDLVRQLRAVGFRGRIIALATSDAPTLSAAASAGVDAVQDTTGLTEGWLGALYRQVCGRAHETPVAGSKPTASR